MKRRRILLVDLNKFFGGGQVYLTQLAELLNERTDLSVFCINPKAASFFRERGIHTVSPKWPLNIGKPLQLLLCVVVCFWIRITRGVDTIWVNGIPEIVAL